MPMSVAIVGGNRTYIFGNKYFCDWYGISQADIVGMSTRLIFQSDADYDAVGKAAYPIIITGGTYDCEHILRRSDGGSYPARTIGRLLDPANPSLGSLWMVDDLTDHKIAGYVTDLARATSELAEANAALKAEIKIRQATEDRLRERTGQVRAILDAAPFPILVSRWNEDEVLFVNSPAEDLLGINRDGLPGLKGEDFYDDPSDHDRIVDTLAKCGVVLGGELRARCADGEKRWLLVSAVRFTYGEVDAIMLCMLDISARKDLEKAQSEAHDRIREALIAQQKASHEQRNFLSMVSHEFRGPLAVIGAASDLLDIYSPSEGEAREEVAKIIRAVRRMSELIDIFLADERLDSTSMPLRISDLDLGAIVTDLSQDMHPVPGRSPLRITIEPPARIEADGTLLRIGIANLIDNALKFSPPGSPVELSITTDQDGATISVTDHGPGISREEQHLIFEKFYRSTKTDRVRGAGLGLYIVRRIVDLHHGRVTVDSRPGQGTTFTIWLPLKADSA